MMRHDGGNTLQSQGHCEGLKGVTTKSDGMWTNLRKLKKALGVPYEMLRGESPSSKQANQP